MRREIVSPDLSVAAGAVSADIPEKSPVTVDITERGMAEEKFRLAVEACPNGMVMIDHDGNMVMVNTEIEQQFGYRREELIGEPVDMLVPARLRSQYAHHRGAFNSRSEYRRIGAGPDLFGLRKDGSEFSIEVGLTPIRTSNGLLVLGVIVDVTERKNMERLKDEFVATVSHELRTPLTSISGSLGLIMAQWTGNVPESAARLLTIADTNCQRLVRLVNDILDIEKIEFGGVVFKWERVGVRTLVDQVIEGNRGFAAGYGVSVRLDTESVDGDVNADSDRLAQVITNLLSNAIKFSPKGGEVLVAVEKKRDVVRISVRDHGPGIPADFKPQIFEKFAQADATSSRQKGGTGLGLSIVKRIIERLGGEVGFDDAPGGGTIFHVELPAWDNIVDHDVDLEAKPDAARILLCEDDRETAIAMRARLRLAGFAVDLAYTSAATLAQAAATSYTAMLIDLRLPDGDGISLIHTLRGQQGYHDTPIIVVSSEPILGRNDVRSSTLNVLGWLSKPVDFEQLIPVLKTSIVSHSTIRPRILHLDDDHNVLTAVTQALRATADVVSVASIEDARLSLLTDRIDLAIVDISLRAGSGLDLLPDLRDSRGNVIPVIIFSAQTVDLGFDEQVHAALAKSHTSLDGLVAAVQNRLALVPVSFSEAVA